MNYDELKAKFGSDEAAAKAVVSGQTGNLGYEAGDFAGFPDHFQRHLIWEQVKAGQGYQVKAGQDYQAQTKKG